MVSSKEISRLLKEKREGIKIDKNKNASEIKGLKEENINLINNLNSQQKIEEKEAVKCKPDIKPEDILLFLEGNESIPSIQITTWSINSINETTGEFTVYIKDEIENIDFDTFMGSVKFDYKGNSVNIQLKNGEYVERAKEILESSDYMTFNKEKLKKQQEVEEKKIDAKKKREKLPKRKIPKIITSPLKGYDEDSRSNVILTAEEDGLKFDRKGVFLGGNKGEQFVRYADIASIGYAKKGFVLGNVLIMVPGGRIKIKNVTPIDGNRFVSAIQKRIMEVKSKANEPVEVEPVKVQQQISPMDEIKKAKELLDMDIITEEEFNKIKNKYLNL